MSIHFFTQSVSGNGQSVTLQYFPFVTSEESLTVAGVNLNYILNNAPLQTRPMTFTNDRYSTSVNAPSGTLDYYYTLLLRYGAGPGMLSIDTKWFSKSTCSATAPPAARPLVVAASGRFRLRGENEKASDAFPWLSYQDAAFNLLIRDYIDSVEFAVFPRTNSLGLDLHAFSRSLLNSVCVRPVYTMNIGVTDSLVKRFPPDTQPYDTSFYWSPGFAWYRTTLTGLCRGEPVDFEIVLPPQGAATPKLNTSATFVYYVGSGRLGQRSMHPWANAAGDASISAVTEPQFAYTQHVVNTVPGRTLHFLNGKALFDTDWKTGFLLGPKFPSTDCNNGPVYTEEKSPYFNSSFLGPKYLQSSCCACHPQAGRGFPPDYMGDTLCVVAFLGVSGPSGVVPHPVYGALLHYQARTDYGYDPDGQLQVAYDTLHGAFADGSAYLLRRPVTGFSSMSSGQIGPDAVYSLRSSPFLCGLGLLEAVDDETILSRSDPGDKDKNGIFGRPNYVTDPVTGTARPGRFGSKAAMPGLKAEIAWFCANALGLSNQYFTDGSGGTQTELSEEGLDELYAYAALLAPPPRKNWQDPSAIRGKTLFEKSGCVQCHVPAMRTGTAHRFVELRDLEIQPFTDLLLHDMGPGESDSFSQGNAQGPYWRTAPLWGLSYISDAGGRMNLLHDGRARSVMEAILWHGGEAESARDAVVAMAAADRADLVAYCNYPFADRLPKNDSCSRGVLFSQARAAGRASLLCSPNPVRTIARFVLPVPMRGLDCKTELTIYNIQGRRVCALPVPTSAASLLFNARSFEAGTYIAQLSAGGMTFRREILIIK